MFAAPSAAEAAEGVSHTGRILAAIAPQYPFGYCGCMITFHRSGEFDAWLSASKGKVDRAIEIARALDKE